MAGRKIPLVIVGGGGHGKVLLNVVGRLKKYQVLGYTDMKKGGPLLGHDWLGDDSVLPKLVKKHKGLVAGLGIGKVQAKSGRLNLLQTICSKGLKAPSIVAPSAVVASDVILGDGSVVFDGAIIQPGTVLGRGAIVNTGARIDHDCQIGDDVHVAPGAVLAGCVKVGDGVFLGAGSVCIQGVSIAPGCTIGAGAVVVSDCERPGLYLGIPARRAAD
jgi:sugar O-acyltransferase (sialic acid O-acetyltransferase NeuD family)